MSDTLTIIPTDRQDSPTAVGGTSYLFKTARALARQLPTGWYALDFGNGALVASIRFRQWLQIVNDAPIVLTVHSDHIEVCTLGQSRTRATFLHHPYKWDTARPHLRRTVGAVPAVFAG